MMMKIAVGGGIDKDGNSYRLPTVKRDVADDFFEKALEDMAATRRADTVVISPEAWEILQTHLKQER